MSLVPLFFFLSCLFLYIHNLSPSVYGGDVGDLVTAAFVHGVPHPPGYSLFTLLGFILTRLHFFTPAFLVGLISAFSGAASVAIFYFTLQKLSKNLLSNIIATFIFGTNYLFWFYNEIAEVFSLNTFFIVLLLYLSIRYYITKKIRTFFFFCLILGLSFTNHQTIILFLPSFLLVITPAFLQSRHKKKNLLLGLLGFLGGLSIYLYIPIASSTHPPINWDNVNDIPSFLHLLLRLDYGTFSPGKLPLALPYQRFIIVKSYLFTLVTQLTIPVILISLVGLFVLLKKQTRIALSLLIGFFISGPLFIGYAGFPLSQAFFFGVYERFFTMSSIIVLYFFPFGLWATAKWFSWIFKKSIYAVFFEYIFFLIPISLFLYNFPKTNLSNLWIGDFLGYDILKSLPSHGALLLSGDTALFNTEYMHYARGVRKDVVILNLSGLDGDTFFNQSRKKIQREFPKEKNPSIILIKTLELIQKDHPVFSSNQLQPVSGQKLLWEPFGLIYRLVDNKTKALNKENFLYQTNAIWNLFHLPNRNKEVIGSLSISEIPTMYSNALLSTGAYMKTTYNDDLNEMRFYKKAITVDPLNSKGFELLGIYEMNSTKNCRSAQKDFISAISLNPTEEIAYFLRYTIDVSCLKDNSDKNLAARQFESEFGESIGTALKQTIKKKQTSL